jgi:UDP-N-acetyl-D-galactosamine dehydrogenase
MLACLLPLAVEFGKRRPVIGFDISASRIEELRAGKDHTLECSLEELKEAAYLRYTHESSDLAQAQIFIVTVPTPVDQANRPDMTAPILDDGVVKNSLIFSY